MILKNILSLAIVIMMLINLSPAGIMDKAIAKRLPGADEAQFLVGGIVRDQNNVPKPGLTVKAFDRNAGAEDTLLGKANTDAQGTYSIEYTTKNLGGKTSANLVLSVYMDDRLLQTSDIIFNARQKEIKDFIIANTAEFDFQRPKKTILPLLQK
jgi:hypothetical protein